MIVILACWTIIASAAYFPAVGAALPGWEAVFSQTTWDAIPGWVQWWRPFTFGIDALWPYEIVNGGYDTYSLQFSFTGFAYFLIAPLLLAWGLFFALRWTLQGRSR